MKAAHPSRPGKHAARRNAWIESWPLAEQICADVSNELCGGSIPIPLKIIRGPRRARPLVNIRSECARRIREELKWSLPQIGAFLNRDHTTIINLLERVRR